MIMPPCRSGFKARRFATTFVAFCLLSLPVSVGTLTDGVGVGFGVCVDGVGGVGGVGGGGVEGEWRWASLQRCHFFATGISRAPALRFALRGGGQGVDQVSDLARQLQSNLDLSGSEGLVGKGHDEGKADDSLIDNDDDDDGDYIDDGDDEVIEEKIPIAAFFPCTISLSRSFFVLSSPSVLCVSHHSRSTRPFTKIATMFDARNVIASQPPRMGTCRISSITKARTATTAGPTCTPSNRRLGVPTS